MLDSLVSKLFRVLVDEREIVGLHEIYYDFCVGMIFVILAFVGMTPYAEINTSDGLLGVLLSMCLGVYLIIRSLFHNAKTQVVQEVRRSQYTTNKEKA